MSTAAPTRLLRIATRKSQLALWQAEHVAALLRSAHPDLAVELLPMSTKGDLILDRSLAAIGGKGLFIKELEIALDQRRADIAVHSMKDVPAQMPAGFAIGAVLARADPHDALLAPRHRRLADLPPHARVGTSSLRRQAQLLVARPDLAIAPLRGNVNSRIRRLDDGEFDAIVLACAGLMRLGCGSRITARLDTRICLPAVGQGVIGVECRGDDAATLARIAVLEHPATRAAVDAERAFAARLGGSCQSPVAAHAQVDGDALSLVGLVAQPDGARVLRDSTGGSVREAAAIGERLADRLVAAGAGALLERLRAG